MNATRTLPTPSTVNAASAAAIPMPTRHVHRARDFGVGYGNSSGYASDRKYVSQWAPPRFKFA
ncbi:hypothetical protein ACFQZQ_10930 [Lysobacter koreensis]|uniref:Uncharacterized protein n=1 Tax=Lysobacter koreensis TaxID=266122 RepID=A0ABW2YQ49_9GAMM